MSRSCPSCAVPLDEGERFCGECGAYVDWSETAAAPDADQRPEPAVEPAVEPEAEPEAERKVVTAPDAPRPRSGPPSRPVAPTEPPRVSTAERPADAPPPPDGAAAWQPPPPPDVAKAMVVPVSDEPAARKPGAPQQPGPQKPGAPAPKARRPRPPADDPIRHGDLVCGQCGIGNKPSRKFCRRCGTTLAEAEVARVGWWRRWRNKRRVKEAGSRPRGAHPRRFRPRVPAALLVLLAVLGIAGVGGFAFREPLLGAVETVRDRIAGTEEVNPSAIRASSSQRGHGAREARDGVSNHYWAPAAAGPGRGETLTVEFEEPIRLVEVLITPGISAEDEELFLTQGRPAELNAVVRRSDGSVEVKDLEFEDKVGPARFGIGVSDVTEVTFEIRRAYRGTADNSRTAIAEVEFQARK
ncbi:NADase-type glycan-binding domain-containing protein [Nocardioides sp. SYSU DS0651]|uniref:NADase-type glycan-binding domain-containing protein n=1 Tax=Nocardioides sp. SYSU DS0651 TaxID=3415955 RepID=UPI003F4B9F84